MKTQSIREAEPSVERSEFRERAAYRLVQEAIHKYCHTYHVTITPRGKNVSHFDLYRDFMKEIMKYKLVKNVFLIAEFETTNHFHGIIYTKDECEFRSLFNKTQKFQFDISPLPLEEWVLYVLKRSYTVGFYNNVPF